MYIRDVKQTHELYEKTQTLSVQLSRYRASILRCYKKVTAVIRNYRDNFYNNNALHLPHLPSCLQHHCASHYNDVIMDSMASQITSITTVYSAVYSRADQRNIKAPRHWPLCGEFAGARWIPRTNGQQRGKCFHFMTSSWYFVRWKFIKVVIQ